ncbi:MAG: hypothetical protein WCQ47_09005, partial [bacterium]
WRLSMKTFSCLVLSFAISFSSLSAQQIQKDPQLKEVNIWGFPALTDGNGNYMYQDAYGRIAVAAYDEKSNSITGTTYYYHGLEKLNGKFAICETTITHPITSGYVGYSGQDKNSQTVTSVFYDKDSFKNKDLSTVCNEYGDQFSTTYVNGIMEGDYYHRSHYHGGNVDETKIVKGKYKNNEKDGEWTEEYMLDCAGTMDTWFDWINGSKHTMTKTTYNNGNVQKTSTLEI